MFPLHIYIPGGVVSFLAVYLSAFSISTASGNNGVEFGLYAIVGTVSTVLFMLLMRVYDELKDVETDIRLGRLGDPRFVNRPIVTGEVTEGDIVTLRWWVTGLIILINLPLLSTVAAAPFLVLFIVSWLSFKWFFVPAISKNILLAFITHNPIALLQHLYSLAIYAAVVGLEQLNSMHLLLVVGLWMQIAAWETSRKIRLTEDETDYQTYSKVLGWRCAVGLPFLFTALSAICLGSLSWMGVLPIWFMLVIAVAALIVLTRCLLLWIAPNRDRTQLKRYLEPYILVSNMTVIIASFWVIP